VPKVSKVFDIDILSPSLPLSIQQIKGMKDLSKVIDGLNIRSNFMTKEKRLSKPFLALQQKLLEIALGFVDLRTRLR
jgi:hypothetical protein